MSKRYNQGGREFIVDQIIERKPRASDNAYTRISSLITSQTAKHDLDNLKSEIDRITSDGIIASYEKQGLQREWASLQSAYTSIAEQFTSDSELSSNPAFVSLRQHYLALADLMADILEDMSSDYVGDVSILSDSFTQIYQELTICETILNSINDFIKNYTINITGSREILGDTQITAGIYRGGTEQQNPEYIDGNNYTWRRIDDAETFTPRNGKSIVINSGDLPVSPCRFSVTWEDKEEKEASLSLIFELQWGTIKQYAWSNALTVEDLQGLMPSAWYDDPPLQPEDMSYLWRRESTDNGKTWQYFRENGENGGAPQYFYKYTKTNDPEAYKGGGILFTYRNKIFAVGSTLLGAGMAGWLDHVPEGEQYQDDYLWTKIVHSDGTYDIIPPPQKGENAKDIRIVASQETYKLSTRGMVQIDQEFTFALQRWYVNGTATWTVSPDPEVVTSDLEIIEQDNPDILKLKIKTGSYLSQFTVSVSCEGFEATRDITILGINAGEESPWYFKVYPEDPNGELPVYNRETGVVDFGNSIWPASSPEGVLITGDYILYKTKVIQNSSDTEGHIEPVPYYFVEGEGTGDAGHWEMLDTNSPYYSEAMGTMLADVVNMHDMPVTVGAMYGFFQNLSAQNAFIENLFAHSIELKNKNGEIGDIHSQGYYRGAWQNEEIDSGFYLGADGYAELFRAILRDVTIISESDSGDVVFSIGNVYPAIEYTHSESGNTKNFEDLLPDINDYNYYDVTIDNKSALLCISEGFISDVGWLRFNTGSVTVPYACTLQAAASNSSGGSVTCNGSTILNLPGFSGEMVWQTFSVEAGDVINIDGFVDVYVRSYPDSDGTTRTIEYKSEYLSDGSYAYTHPTDIAIAGVLLVNATSRYSSYFPICVFDSYDVPSNRTTGIVCNGVSFDSIAWRRTSLSNLISSMKMSFTVGQEYSATSGSTFSMKGVTYNVTSFIIQGNILSLTTTQGQLSVSDDYYAKSAILNTEAQDGATIIKTLLPAKKSATNPTRQVGSAGDRFDNIYSISGNFSGKLTANRLSSTNTPLVIFQYAGDAVENNDYSIVNTNLDPDALTKSFYSNRGFRLWNNRFIEISGVDQIAQDDETYVYFEELIAGENLGGDVNLDFDTLPYVSVVAYGNYDSLSGNGNTPVLSVNRINSKGCYVLNDGVTGQFCIRIEGFLNQEAFNYLVSEYGIQI